MTLTRSRSFVLVALCWLLSIAASPVAAQIPDKVTNLQLLDKDSSPRQVVGIMRDWAGGLGVRCNHCHVGPDNLVGMDFASDEKATKRTARRMLEMSRTLNRTLLKDLPSTEGERTQVVSCYTCHRGQSKPPRNIDIVLGEIARDKSVDAALDEFRRLRTEFDNQGVYDLRPSALNGLAGLLFAHGRAEDAVNVLEAGLAIDPGSTDLSLSLAMAHAQAGDLEQARAILEQALAADPDHPHIKGAMTRLEAMAKTDDDP